MTTRSVPAVPQHNKKPQAPARRCFFDCQPSPIILIKKVSSPSERDTLRSAFGTRLNYLNCAGAGPQSVVLSWVDSSPQRRDSSALRLTTKMILFYVSWLLSHRSFAFMNRFSCKWGAVVERNVSCDSDCKSSINSPRARANDIKSHRGDGGNHI